MAGTATVVIPDLTVPTTGGTGSGGSTPLSGTPMTHRAEALAVVAGASTDLDALQIGSGLTGRLCGIIIGATVSIKGTVHTVSDGVASGALFDIHRWNGSTKHIEFKDTRFFTIAESAAAGIDTFRVTIENCDTSATGDIAVTFMWEEL